MPRVAKPKPDEPIRTVETQTGIRYRAVIDGSRKGEKRRQLTKTFDDLTAARAWIATTRAEIDKGTYTVASKVTVAELADQWLASRRDIREVSRNGYRDALTPVLDRIGHRPAQSITRHDIEAVMEALETEGGRQGRPLSQRSQVYSLGAIRQVFTFGVTSGALPTNPAQYVKARRKRKGDRKEVAVWSPAELRRFREHVDQDDEEWVRAGFRLTACGLRRGEVLGLAWSSVDLEAGTIRVEASRVKTGRGNRTSRDDAKSPASDRTVAVETLHPGTVAALRALRVRQAADRLAAGGSYADDGLVIVDALGCGIHPDAYSWRWAAICTEAGLPPIRLHAVRHTLALLLHRGGVAPADAAALLGHELATHLQYYVRATESGAASAASRAGELIAMA